MPDKPSAAQPVAPKPGRRTSFDEDLDALQRRLQREAAIVVAQVEGAVSAFKTLDIDAAKAIRRRDDEVDENEVQIEEECIRLIALHQPVASDLRRLTVSIRINVDVERIADHATGVCKAVLYLGDTPPPVWPKALIDMADRIVPRCRQTQALLHKPNVRVAHTLIDDDDTLDHLGKVAFAEIEEAMQTGALSRRAGLLAFRAMRDFERIGDLCGDVAEDVIYLETGRIVRHSKGPRVKAE